VELGLNLNSFADLKGTSKSSSQNVSSPGKSKGEDVQSFQSQLKRTSGDSSPKARERYELDGAPRREAKNEAEPKKKENLSTKSSANENNVNSQNYDNQGFNEKPIGPVGPTYNPPSIAATSEANVDRVLPDPVSSSKVSEKLNASSVDNLTRRVAWQRFLQKMKSELDVSAEDILAAFSALTPEELELPPEQNIDKLVEQLGLNPQQSQMANQLFTDLMDKTGSRPFSQELKASGRDINLSVMSQREQDQRKVTMALDRMNQQFFMKAPPANPQGLPPEGLMAPSAESMPLSEKDLLALQEASKGHPLREVTLKSGEKISPELLQRLNSVSESEGKEILARLAQGKSLEQGAGEVEADQDSEQDPMAAFFQKGEVRTQVPVNAAQAPTKASMKASSEDTIAQIFQKSLGAASGAATAVASKPEAGGDADSGSAQQEGFNGEAALASTAALGASMTSKQSGEFETALQGLGLNTDPKGSNLESLTSEALLQKTQVMIREGGGDVKVILEPEGLGEVAMKVSVHGDKVNVEMITESDAAKKILERGMGDLKNHLLASQLDLQSIKVDTASNLGQQLEQQYQDAQRQQAYNFMQEFRQDNQQFRQGFTEMPGARNYRSQTKANAPVIEGAPPPKSEQGRRLNLVA